MTWIPKPYIPTTEEITLDKSMSKLASVGNLTQKGCDKKGGVSSWLHSRCKSLCVSSGIFNQMYANRFQNKKIKGSHFKIKKMIISCNPPPRHTLPICG